MKWVKQNLYVFDSVGRNSNYILNLSRQIDRKISMTFENENYTL